MKHRLLGIVVFLVLASCAGPRSSPVFNGPAPLAVLLEEDHWIMVIGADVPLVALYANGLLIYRDVTIKNDLPFRSIRLAKDELNKIQALIGPSQEFLALHPYFNLADAFDLPTVKLFVSDENQHKMVSIYGCDIDRQQLVYRTNRNIVPPGEFVRVQTVLSALSYPAATLWLPEYFEIIIWPYEYAPNQRAWPDTFPHLKDKRSIRRDRGGYSLFIEGSRKDELVAFFSQVGEKEAVVIDGKKWAVFIRPVFPSEPIWRAAEREYKNVLPKDNRK